MRNIQATELPYLHPHPPNEKSRKIDFLLYRRCAITTKPSILSRKKIHFSPTPWLRVWLH